MTSHIADQSEFILSQGSLRLDTLVRIRWLAIAGQAAAVLFVHFGLGFPLPLLPALGFIALSALLNAALRLRFPVARRLSTRSAGLLLGYDVIQLAGLLFLTGGLQNPFSILFLAPVLISATALPPRTTLSLGLLAVGCASLLAFYHDPLPWDGAPLQLPFMYVAGVWTALLLALGFIGSYAWRVSDEARQLSEALAATELVLAREQHLSALDGLAAAAAHELGTPLATIALVSKELGRAVPDDSPLRDDLNLLIEQVGRCRDILKTLSTLDEGGAPHGRMALSVLVEETVAPSRSFGVAITARQAGSGPEPVGNRNPGILYGVGNLIENAVDFARTEVLVTTRWDDSRVEVEIADDGPGFSPEIRARLGEPYVSSRGGTRRGGAPEAGGLGLGFFIAKTLLERTGAKVEIHNATPPSTGAVVRVTWPRAQFEAVATERA
jgi:two-component system sensor histidine kinase RegB